MKCLTRWAVSSIFAFNPQEAPGCYKCNEAGGKRPTYGLVEKDTVVTSFETKG
jgi:hypothetical protein